MRLLTAGPDEEFDDFVTAASGALMRTAYLLVGDRGHAEDLLQTALLRTAQHWEAAKLNPSAYARRVLVNLAKDRWRHRSRRPAETVMHEVAEPHANDAEGRFLLQDSLLQATRKLPSRQRTVLVLRYFDDLSVEDTAAAMGCDPGTVKSQTHHALRRLRELLNEADNEDLTERKPTHAER